VVKATLLETKQYIKNQPMNRQRIVAGNWKMNKDYAEGRDLAKDIVARLQPTDTLVVLCPSFVHLYNLSNIIRDVSNLKLGAQNCHEAENGAYTGEVSAAMLRSVGVEYVILGHSERREYAGETDALLVKKIDRVLASGMRPIFCCGEKLEARKADTHLLLVAGQVEQSLFHLSPEAIAQVVIAYEPVWAIGTGMNASPEQAQEMHAYIRSLLRERYGETLADSMSILYGGSVKPDNARELFDQPDVDGGLIGGASLNSEDFIAIVEAAH
jgi:triosephosphate isomerase